MQATKNARLLGDADAIPSGVADYVLTNMDSLPTPLYLYDEAQLASTVGAFRAQLPESVRLFYSLKANPQPEIVRMLGRLGVGSELASDGERRMIDLAELDWSEVIAGGVAKSADYLKKIVERRPAAVVVDSVSEWARLESVVGESDWAPPVLLRISPGESTGGLDMAGESQFGMELSDALKLAEMMRQTGEIQFLGLHFYFGSQRLVTEPIRKTIEIAGDAVEQFKQAGIPPEVVDIGLGKGVPYLVRDESVDDAALAKEIASEFARSVWDGVKVWSEAGRALAAPCGVFVARILEQKTLHGKEFVFLDGGVNVHNPGIGLGRFFRSNPRIAFATRNSAETDRFIDVVGNLCTSADCLARNVEAPALQAGDLVMIPNSGAYCQTTGFWGFNSQPLCGEAVLRSTGEIEPLTPLHSLLG